MYQECSSWLLRTIEPRNARGCGVVSDVSVCSRSGCAVANAHATAPPQSCPPRWTRSAPLPSTGPGPRATSRRSRQPRGDAGRVDEREHVSNELAAPVVTATHRPRPRGVPTLVRREHAVAGVDEQRGDLLPGGPVLRVAVQEHEDITVCRPGVGDIEGQGVAAELLHPWTVPASGCRSGAVGRRMDDTAGYDAAATRRNAAQPPARDSRPSATVRPPGPRRPTAPPNLADPCASTDRPSHPGSSPMPSGTRWYPTSRRGWRRRGTPRRSHPARPGHGVAYPWPSTP